MTRASAKITSLGGKAAPRQDLGDRLRIAVCSDPMGAGFDLWEAKQHGGSEVGGDEHGAPCWFETLTADAKRAAQFYHEAFGWTVRAMPSSGIDYAIFNRGADGVAGMLVITPDMGNMPSQWLTYFNVASADAAATAAVKLGAEICMPMKDVPSAGRFCGITSPQGVMFYVIEPTP